MEVRELEIKRISQSLNLKAVKKTRSRHDSSARESKSIHLVSQQSQTPSGAPPQGSKLFLRLWRPLLPVKDGASQTTKTQLGVIPQDSPDQSQAQSDSREVEPPLVEDISSEGKLPDSDSEDHSGT